MQSFHERVFNTESRDEKHIFKSTNKISSINTESFLRTKFLIARVFLYP